MLIVITQVHTSTVKHTKTIVKVVVTIASLNCVTSDHRAKVATHIVAIERITSNACHVTGSLI